MERGAKIKFVASMPMDTPLEEVVAAAAAAGLDTTVSSVYQMRQELKRREKAGLSLLPHQERVERRARLAAFLEPILSEPAPAILKKARKAQVRLKEHHLNNLRTLKNNEPDQFRKLVELGRSLPEAPIKLPPKRASPTKRSEQTQLPLRTTSNGATKAPKAARAPVVKAPAKVDDLGVVTENEEALMRMAVDVGLPRSAQLLQHLQNTIVAALNQAIGR